MIEVVEYRPIWPVEFGAIGPALRRQLGDLAVRIDHIGSTSIPGLASKDVIDVQITVRTLEPAIEQALQAMGYIRRPHHADHIPPGKEGRPDDWSKWLFGQPVNQRVTNVHVRLEGRPNQRYPLLFRDYLRFHDRAVRAYERVKMALARLHPHDMDAYTEVKDPACDIIMAAAEDWAFATGWQPGPSDA